MSSSSAAFRVICLLHSVIALTSGALMMFYMKEIYMLTHGSETAAKLVGSSPHDQLLIETSDSFSGLLLFAIGFLLFMVSFVRDKAFQSFFAKGCTLLHIFMAMWRVYFERRVEDFSWDLLRKTVGDSLLALSWVLFLVYSWREKSLDAMRSLCVRWENANCMSHLLVNNISRYRRGCLFTFVVKPIFGLNIEDEPIVFFKELEYEELGKMHLEVFAEGIKQEACGDTSHRQQPVELP